MFAAECAALTFAGLSVGVIVHHLTQAAMGTGGWLPVTWWPGSGELPGLLSAPAVFLGTAAAWMAGRGLVRSADRLRLHRPPPPNGRGARAARLAVLVAGAYLIGLLAYWLVAAPTVRQPGPLTLSVLAAVIVGTAGLLVISATWGRAAAVRLADTVPLASVRLGLRGAAHHAAASSRFVSALVLLSVLAGTASGFLTGVGRWGQGYVGKQALEVDVVSSLDKATIEALVTELEIPFVVQAFDEASGALIVAGDCAGVTVFDRLVRARPGECAEGEVQVGDELGLGGPLPERLALDDRGGPVVVPRGAAVQDVRWSVKLPAADRIRLARVPGASLFVPLQNGAGESAVTRVFATRFPEVPVRAGLKDPDSYSVYRHYSSVLQIAFWAAGVMAATALSFVALELAWSNARQAGALAAVGVGRRQLRAAGSVQASWPVLCVLPAAAFGVVAGLAVRSYFGTTDLLEAAIPAAVLGPWLAALVISATAGAVAIRTRFDRASISDA